MGGDGVSLGSVDTPPLLLGLPYDRLGVHLLLETLIGAVVVAVAQDALHTLIIVAASLRLAWLIHSALTLCFMAHFLRDVGPFRPLSNIILDNTMETELC